MLAGFDYCVSFSPPRVLAHVATRLYEIESSPRQDKGLIKVNFSWCVQVRLHKSSRLKKHRDNSLRTNLLLGRKWHNVIPSLPFQGPRPPRLFHPRRPAPSTRGDGCRCFAGKRDPSLEKGRRASSAFGVQCHDCPRVNRRFGLLHSAQIGSRAVNQAQEIS